MARTAKDSSKCPRCLVGNLQMVTGYLTVSLSKDSVNQSGTIEWLLQCDSCGRLLQRSTSTSLTTLPSFASRSITMKVE